MAAIDKNRQIAAHLLLAEPFIAPIPTDSYDFQAKKAEELCFDDELRNISAIYGFAIRNMVSKDLLPASMIAMEDFAIKYAKDNSIGERRQSRLEMQYSLGAMIGLASIALESGNHGGNWEERSQHEVLSLATLINYNDPKGYIKPEPLAEKYVDEMSKHTTADMELSFDKNLDEFINVGEIATKVGYQVARNLGAAAIIKFN